MMDLIKNINAKINKKGFFRLIFFKSIRKTQSHKINFKWQIYKTTHSNFKKRRKVWNLLVLIDILRIRSKNFILKKVPVEKKLEPFQERY